MGSQSLGMTGLLGNSYRRDALRGLILRESSVSRDCCQSAMLYRTTQ